MKNKVILFKAMSAIFLLSLTVILPSQAVKAGLPDTLSILQVTDIHVCNLTGYHPFFVEKRQHFGKNILTFPEFLKSVPDKLNADLMVITGDNVDFYEAEASLGRILDTQVEQYSRILDNCKIPVYLTLGNHDIASYWIDEVPSVKNSQLNAERARAAWMRNVPCFKEGTYYSRIFKVDDVTVRLIFLDNAYYATEEIADGVLPFSTDQYQMRWLDDQLKASSSDIELIFMHIPLPYGQSAGNMALSEKLSAYTSKSNTYNLLKVLDANSSTRMIFAGHKHINSINNYTLPDGDKLTQVMTAAYGYGEMNWRMIKITADNILICVPGSTSIEYKIPIR